MEAIVLAVLALVEELGPAVAATGTIGKIISALEVIIPIVVDTVPKLASVVKIVVATLRGNGNVTTEQLDQLDAIEAKIDADFDKDTAAAEKEEKDAEAGGGQTPG